MAKNINIQPYDSITLEQCTELIACCGRYNTVIAQGETGIGKSFMHKSLAKRFPDYVPIYLDCTTKEAGDLAMPKIYDIDGKFLLDFVPSKELGMYLNKPVIVMIDEIGKATRPIQNVLCRFIYERKIGEYELHPDSIVFATTNLAEEGFGDNAPAYMRNRSLFITVRKPNAQEWVENFAMGADIHPTVMVTVSEHQEMLSSWKDSSEKNEFIFDPSNPSQTFVTPRSLELASNLLKQTEHLDHDVKVHMLAGQIGKPAAMLMMTIHALHNDLPRYDEIIKAPSKAKVPTKSAAVCLLIYNILSRVEKNDVSSIMAYIKRLDREQQALFATGALRSTKAASIACDPEFIKWGKDNSFLFRDN